MDPQLQTLIDLQTLDSKLAELSEELAKLPAQLAAMRASVAGAAKRVETLRTKLDATRKETRLKEKDLEFSAAKRAKAEARWSAEHLEQWGRRIPRCLELQRSWRRRSRSEPRSLGRCSATSRLLQAVVEQRA